MTSNIIATKLLTAQFEEVLAIVDTTVTGAILGGVHPIAFEALLSIWFLRFALTGRIGKTSDKHFDKWCEIDRVWTPVVSRVMDFVEDFEGVIKPTADCAELDYLRKECKIRDRKQSEIEKRRDGKRAIQTMEWLLFTFGKRAEPIDESLVELAYLVVWFKLAVLLKQTDDETYLIVRQNWLAVQHAYAEVMDQKWLANG
ncbi:hypothetical protein BH11CYA1_BH11CYA1_48740 [soil metagenome]